MTKVKYLEWDSLFFKKKIGKVNLYEDEKFELSSFENYDLIYLFSDNSKLKFPLMDKKVVLEINDLSKISNNDSIFSFFDFTTDSYDEILLLALQSGIYSRFKRDINFKDNEYEKLYKEWLDKSLNKELAIEVIVKKINSKIVGFSTISRKSEILADIGLVAVDHNYRGRGIGKELMEKTIAFAKKEGFKSLQVVTQLDNEPAMKLYQKAGFKISLINYIYHIWNHDTI